MSLTFPFWIDNNTPIYLAALHMLLCAGLAVLFCKFMAFGSMHMDGYHAATASICTAESTAQTQLISMQNLFWSNNTHTHTHNIHTHSNLQAPYTCMYVLRYLWSLLKRRHYLIEVKHEFS